MVAPAKKPDAKPPPKKPAKKPDAKPPPKKPAKKPAAKPPPRQPAKKPDTKPPNVNRKPLITLDNNTPLWLLIPALVVFVLVVSCIASVSARA